MALSLTLPQIGDKSTTKDYIISVLGYDWPLSAKKVYNLIKKKYGHDVTYQAVYKTIHELIEKGVLEKKSNEYQINLKWLKDLHSYTEVIETNYYTKNRLKLIEGIKDAKKEGNINVLTFETFFDVEKYLYYLQKQYILSSKSKEVICVHHNHEWRPLFYLRAEYNWIKKVKGLGHQTYILCAGNTVIDRWCADFYRSIGCNVKLNTNCASTCELIVFGDVIIQVYLPSEIKSSIKGIFSKLKDVSKINQKTLIESIFEKKTDIKVIINKDYDLAEQIKKDTISNFC
ncbi:hypothetical protein FJZ53_01765 [Candidatus Woesearchaeota archaeon]|nr:hypothetical protein [Candidatus Woesearchaeota archaeon]